MPISAGSVLSSGEQCLSSKLYALPVAFPDGFQVVTAHEKNLAKHEVQSVDRTVAHCFFSRNKFQKAIAILLAEILLPIGDLKYAGLIISTCCLVTLLQTSSLNQSFSRRGQPYGNL